MAPIRGSVEHIAVAIERLWIGRPRHNGIRAEEATQFSVIPSGIVVTQAFATRQATFMVLAGEAFCTQAAKCRPAAIAAIGQVVVGGQSDATLVDKAATGLQVVLQQVEDTVIDTIPAAAHGIREPSGCIVGGHLVGGAIFDELKDPGNVDRGHAVYCALDAVAVSVVDKAGRRPPLMAVRRFS